jgi:FMN phosphatase YigB (HAD superfamily)
VLDMLDTLRQAGLAIVVVSNCSVEEAAHLGDSPLATRVDDVVWSFRERVQKPEAEIYRRACERAGAAASETCFVGDGSFDELEGARAAGLAAIWASWFTDGWPSHLAAARRARIESFDGAFPEARTPADVVARLVGGGDATRPTPHRATRTAAPG